MVERRVMPTKRTVLSIFVILTLLSMVSFAKATPDPFSTLVVWPYDTPEGAEGPIVTTSPANLIIYNNDNSHILTDVWLTLVINQLVKDNLVSIFTNTSLSFLPVHFTEIDSTESPSYKIPLPGSETSAWGTWPGLEVDDAYDVGSLRSKLDIADGESMWYAVGDLDSSPGWVDHGPAGLNKQDPEYFTLTVDLGGSGGNWKVLVLALGYVDVGMHTEPGMLNVHSPYTRSTLVVSEVGALLLALAPASAFGLYKIRHKIRKK